VSALTFYGIGSYFEGASWATSGKHVFGTNLNYGGFASKVLAHGVAGGALQHLQGGRFGSGFAAAGITQAFSGAIDGIDPANPSFPWEPVLAAALLGGAVSDLTGGKFAHGAVTSAFAVAFNQLQHNAAQADANLTAVSSDRYAIAESGLSKADATTRPMERWGADGYRSGREANWFTLEMSDGTYAYTFPQVSPKGATTSNVPDPRRLVGRRFGSVHVRKVTYAGHNHLIGDLEFSGFDLMVAGMPQYRGVPLLMWNENGAAAEVNSSLVKDWATLPASHPGIPRPQYDVKRTW
jgi:hypothetical protein